MKRIFSKTILLTTLVVLVLDQATKYIIEQWIPTGGVVPIIPGCFNLVLTYNKGVAFGIFSNISDDYIRHTVLFVTTIFALGAVYLFAVQPGSDKALIQIALGLILGGAFGNIIDRVTQGAVTDFLDFYYGSYHWPAFNVADSSICIAIVLLLLSPQPLEDSSIEKKTVV